MTTMAGVLTATLISVLTGFFLFLWFKRKSWNPFLKAVLVAMGCFFALYIVALVGMLTLWSGSGSEYLPFGEGYLITGFFAPGAAFVVSLGAFALTRRGASAAPDSSRMPGSQNGDV